MDERRLEHTNALLEELLKKNNGDFDKTAREGITADLFTRSEVEEIISETCLSEEDRKIATEYFVERQSKEELARIHSYDRRTISRKIDEISFSLKNTTLKFLRTNHISPILS